MNPQELLSRAGACANRFAKEHPRRLGAAVVALLGGFAVTAFGIAPMAPDAADLPRRIVDETVVPDALGEQLEALGEHGLQLSRSELTRANDNAAALLKRLGVIDAAAADFLRGDAQARQLFDGKPGKMVKAQVEGSGQLVELVARYAAADDAQALTHFNRLTLRRVDGRWRSTLELAELQADARLGGAMIRSTLAAAAKDADLPDSVMAQLTEMFDGDVNFRGGLKRGDGFSVVYQTLAADGEQISWNGGAGRVLAAEFRQGRKLYQGLWYPAAAGGQGAYFNFDGKSKQSAFLASPLEFARLTSSFAMRVHPISGDWRQHRGIDLGAPNGTPVRSVGEGVIDFAGVQSGYGNVVEVRHDKGRSTLYAHLSRVDVKAGDRVTLGQTIGAVGATGWATGPHLHFEYRVNGEHQDPTTLAAQTDSLRIDAASKREFGALARNYGAQLLVAQSLQGVRRNVE